MILSVFVCLSVLFTSLSAASAEGPWFETTSLEAGKVSEYYYQYIYTGGSEFVYQYELVNSETDDTPYSLPDGFYGQPMYTQKCYRISGLPTTTGTYHFALAVVDCAGNRSVKNFTMVIDKADPLVITSEERLPNATAGESYDAGIYSNLCISKWKLKEGFVLPEGLALDEDGDRKSVV